MKGDNSRDTFRATKHYAQVRMQQGRVQVDADWNEQGEIVAHRIETETLDVIGASGAPLQGVGFKILTPATNMAAGDFRIASGRFYVNGILCINETPTTFTTQPDLPGVTPLANAALYLIYIDVWQRHLTALEDPSIREVALGGPDTATRVKNVWQVKAVPVAANLTCLSAPLPQAQSSGKLAARTKLEAISTNPCVVPPGAGYRGLENQLYRVEVHTPGGAVDVNTAPAPILVTAVPNTTNQVRFTSGTWTAGQAIEIVSTTPGVSPMNGRLATITAVDTTAKTLTLNANILSIPSAELRLRPAGATFKWSRENGSIVTAVEGLEDTDVTVHDLGPDTVLGFNEGQWVEYIDDAMELKGEPGVLAQIVKIDRAINFMKLSIAPPPLALVAGGAPDLSKHPRVRKWDGVGAIKFRPGNAPENDLELENGVMIRFTGGNYRNADYWMIPARTATADAQSGNIEWPVNASGAPLEQSPFGIRHHLARLGMLRFDGTKFTEIRDCRNLFPAITELTTLVYVSGDGQEAMPGNPLPQLLQAGVFNGRWPVQDASVRFTAQPNGKVAPNAAALPLPATTNTVVVKTGADGIASCAWLPDKDVNKPSQQCEARLLDANSDPTPSIIRYNANLSIASQVFYEPGDCKAMAGRGTVQSAVDQLARLVSLYEVSGGHQDIVPGGRLDPLVVLAANRCGPVANRKVTFKVVAGSGQVEPAETSTNADGKATATWTPDESTVRQEVEATLVDESPISTAAPTRVRFIANLIQRDPGIHITEVTTIVDKANLGNDSVVNVDRLTEGILISCDGAMVGTSVGSAPEGSIFPQNTQIKPTCFVTIDLPFPSTGQDREFWKASPVIGFQPLILHGSANLPRGLQGTAIRWLPAPSTIDWLRKTLFTILLRNQIADRVLAHLTLKGNFIWSGEGEGKQRFLDGNAFGFTNADGRTGIPFPIPTGDGVQGGDFEMWFWLAAPPPLVNFVDVSSANRSVRGAIRDAAGAPLPGVTVTLTSTATNFAPRSAVTDVNGTFVFTVIPPGNYTVTANLAGETATAAVTVI